jgi:hypothetical protein
MAGQGPLLKSLATLVAAFDASAWETLANKGLVRRAQKDLEAGLAVVLEEEAECVRFKLSTCEVTMPAAGPAKATCSCPARGVCQHILAAGMWLQKLPQEERGEDAGVAEAPPTRERIVEEMLALTIEQLEIWAGVAALREGRRMAASGKIDPGASGVVAVEFPDQGIKTRFVAGGGLDGIMVGGASRSRQPVAAVAAVLCVHLAHGRWSAEEAGGAKALEEARQAPRTRDEVLLAARVLIQEALEVGLAHVSNALQERLQTLAMSAQGTNLPRLARMLRALVDETGAIVGRLGRASGAGLLLTMARAYALVEALQQPAARARPDLIGVPRTQYDELSRLDLLGASAFPWRTASGYIGLTVLYWDPGAKCWLSWTDARPATQAAGFDPMLRFQGSGPWEGIESPAESARSRVALIGPRRNPAGRLSSSASTKAMALGPVSISDFEFGPKLFTDWSELRAYIGRVFPIGLREVSPMDLIVVLQPRRLGRRFFDEQRQLFHWELGDENGAAFSLVIPYSDYTAGAIKRLESLTSAEEPRWRFIAKIYSSEIGLAAEPLTLHRVEETGEAIVHLAFSGPPPPLPSTAALTEASRESEEEWEDEETEAVTPTIPRAIERLLHRLEKGLERAAESGAAAFDPSSLKPIRAEAERLGLLPLAKALHPSTPEAASLPRLILKLRYLSALYRQSAAFA